MPDVWVGARVMDGTGESRQISFYRFVCFFILFTRGI